jgi:hypothetical protein
MIGRKYEITPSSIVLLPPLVNTVLAVKPRFREILERDLDVIGDLLTCTAAANTGCAAFTDKAFRLCRLPGLTTELSLPISAHTTPDRG